MSRPAIQTLIDRLRIIVEGLGWSLEVVDTSGPTIKVTISHPKPEAGA